LAIAVEVGYSTNASAIHKERRGDAVAIHARAIECAGLLTKLQPDLALPETLQLVRGYCFGLRSLCSRLALDLYECSRVLDNHELCHAPLNELKMVLDLYECLV
jgi:hypothetical protein